MGVVSMERLTGDSHALRTSGRATHRGACRFQTADRPSGLGQLNFRIGRSALAPGSASKNRTLTRSG